MDGRVKARGRDRARERDRGQVTIELLGMTPLIILTLVLMWQIVLVGYTYTLAGNAADEAVRAATAAVRGGARDAACRQAGLDKLSAAWRSGAQVSCWTSNGFVTADVYLNVPVLFPGSIGFHVPGIHGHAGAVEEATN
ncbi:TadE/TadG family type IV pilus assembly protein [Streptomyces sp. NPDC005423]|uniref:TadE/TadG family type IV pilus assembly protein n=1 Tax=Streptomyces sp. NPDC005423 TaxID=3155343 RepID=UPI0033A22429